MWTIFQPRPIPHHPQILYMFPSWVRHMLKMFADAQIKWFTIRALPGHEVSALSNRSVDERVCSSWAASETKNLLMPRSPCVPPSPNYPHRPRSHQQTPRLLWRFQMRLRCHIMNKVRVVFQWDLLKRVAPCLKIKIDCLKKKNLRASVWVITEQRHTSYLSFLLHPIITINSPKKCKICSLFAFNLETFTPERLPPCMLSNVSSNYLIKKMHNDTGCNCLTFLHCVFHQMHPQIAHLQEWVIALVALFCNLFPNALR